MKSMALLALGILFSSTAFAEEGAETYSGPRLSLSAAVKKLVDEGRVKLGKTVDGHLTIEAPRNLLHCELHKSMGSHIKSLICLSKEEYLSLANRNKRMLQNLDGKVWPQ